MLAVTIGGREARGLEDDFLTLQTPLTPHVLRTHLEKWAPWSHRIDFSNGLSTVDCARRVPFNQFPLRKFRFVEQAIPFAKMSGGRLLDIGCNAGYNSIHAARKYGFTSVGIDVVPRHLEVARWLTEMASVEAQFCEDSAETFSRPGQFDVVLHFGTLYHLRNPLLSLQQTFQNLRPGGYCGLETQVYDHPADPDICYFMHMHNNDPTNYWALSTPVLVKALALTGFREIVELKKVEATGLAEYMSRIFFIARRPESSPLVRRRPSSPPG